MRIAIDARPATGAVMTGIGFYTKEMVERLPIVDPQTDYLAWYLNARSALKPWRTRRVFARRSNLRERGIPFPGRWFERLAPRDLPRLEWLARFDVLFAPNFVPPPTRSPRLVLTIHDLAFLLMPETAPHATEVWLLRLHRAIEQAAQVIAVSEATKRDVLEHFPIGPDRVTVVHHGVDRDRYRPAPDEDVARIRTRHRLDGPYLLFVGGIEPRKNLPALVRAYAMLEDRPYLVIGGPAVPWSPRGRPEMIEALAELPDEVRARVRFTGFLREEDKIPLLTGAEALVFPSRYEGFGMPLLEAMACGTPIVTSGVSALPEVAGDAAVYVDPDEPEDIARGMRTVLEDEALRAALRKAGLERVEAFDWDETARRTARILHRAALA